MKIIYLDEKTNKQILITLVVNIEFNYYLDSLLIKYLNGKTKNINIKRVMEISQ